MDMELQHTRLGGERPVYQAILRQEETLESIVPDAMPDISRIVQACGTVLLRQKEALDGSVRVTGTVRTAILYQPEDGGEPRCITLNIPFLCSGDHPALQGGCQIRAQPSVIGADAQLINPRKLLARVELSVEVTAWSEDRTEICEQAEPGEDTAVQTLIERHKDFVAVDVAEKSFSFSDVLRLPASRPTMERLLSVRTELCCSEAKAIGKKLVVKGAAVLTALYCSPEGIASARFEMPFSQIVEVRGGDDESIVRADAALMGCECTMRTEGELEVSLEVLLQAVVMQEREVSVLADLYSVAHAVETERGTAVLCPLVEQGSRRELARQFCESAIAPRRVVDCALTMGQPELSAADAGSRKVTVTAFAEILFVTEDESLCAVSYNVPVSCEIPAREDCRCRCRCVPVGEPTATPVSGGLEVRFEAEFSYLVCGRTEAPCVLQARPGQEEEPSADRPSVVIRMVGEGERLWDIAKLCASTIEDIRAANAMEGESAPAGTLLLIPKCR